MQATVLDHGATLTSLTLPGASGDPVDVVLGYDSLDGFLENRQFFGATVGRYANRLAKGRLSIRGVDYQLAINNGQNHLHGGPLGFHRVHWSASASETAAGPEVVLDYLSPDGEEGYPGELSVRVRYELTHAGELVIRYEARTNKTTVVNLTHHSYFNLSGREGGVEGHLLRLLADRFTPTDEHQIPTGEIRTVAQTPFDFRELSPIGARIDASDPDLVIGSGYDHNYVVSDWDGTLRCVAEVVEPSSGRTLRVLSTEPGVQFYSGNYLDGVRGKAGQSYGPRAGFCLEPQHFPDSPNRPEFPSTLLEPGNTYRQTSVYAFA